MYRKFAERKPYNGISYISSNYCILYSNCSKKEGLIQNKAPINVN